MAKYLKIKCVFNKTMPQNKHKHLLVIKSYRKDMILKFKDVILLNIIRYNN